MKHRGPYFLLAFAALLTPAPADPAWWTAGDPPVINSNPANNKGPANIGQAKHMVSEALAALTLVDPILSAQIRQRLTTPQPHPTLPGEILPPVLDLSVPADPKPAGWQDKQKAPLLIGQLKAIAAPFYDRLDAAAHTWLDRSSTVASEKGQLQLNGTRDPSDSNNIYPWSSAPEDDQNRAAATIGQLKAVLSLRFETLQPFLDLDEDGVPDYWERDFSLILLDDYGITAPNDPAAFDVNADYGGLNVTAALVYQNLATGFEIPATELIATPIVSGTQKGKSHSKIGYVEFPMLDFPPFWPETGPVLNFYRTLSVKLDYHYSSESPAGPPLMHWDDDVAHKEYSHTHSWNISEGLSLVTTDGPQSWLSERTTWAIDPDSPVPATRPWVLTGNDYFLFLSFVNDVSGDPPTFDLGMPGSLTGAWTSITPTKRISNGVNHTTGTQISKPTPGTGYVPTYKKSETFTYIEDLSDPYTTADLIADARLALNAETPGNHTPYSYRNLVENETKIALKEAKYRLSWTVPNNVPISPGNTQAKVTFLWQEVHDVDAVPSTGTASSRKIAWKRETAFATPGSTAQTPIHDLPTPEHNGTSWIRPVIPGGSITMKKAILVNKDDDDGDGQEDRNQAAHSLPAEDDLIALNFQASAPNPYEKSLIYRLEASGAGKARLWMAFPNEQPQPVALPYRLRTRDYIGGAGPRPTYYIEGTHAGSVSLQLHAEIVGQKLATVAKADFQCLDISVDLAPGMKGVIGDIVPSNRAGSNAVHFVTTKSASSTDAVVLAANGITPDQITVGHANRIAEWVEVSETPVTIEGKISRFSANHKKVTIRLLGTGQSCAALDVWVTWADLQLLDDPLEKPYEVATSNNLMLKAHIQYRYTCQPNEMFDLSKDIPNFNLPPSPPAPGGNHPWPNHEALANGAAIRYDATRQVRVVMRSSDSGLLNSEHLNAPDIPDFPTDIGIGNDDPNMRGELMPYEGAVGEQGVMRDLDSPYYKLTNSTGVTNSTFLLSAQFRQYARVQIGVRWYQCSDLALSDLKFKFKKNATAWVNDNSSFDKGNGTFPPP